MLEGESGFVLCQTFFFIRFLTFFFCVGAIYDYDLNCAGGVKRVIETRWAMSINFVNRSSFDTVMIFVLGLSKQLPENSLKLIQKLTKFREIYRDHKSFAFLNQKLVIGM